MGSVCTGVVVFHRSMVDWRRGWILYTLVSVQSSICEHLVSVVVFHRSMVNWRRRWGLSALVSVHSSICETYLV